MKQYIYGKKLRNETSKEQCKQKLTEKQVFRSHGQISKLLDDGNKSFIFTSRLYVIFNGGRVNT